MNTPEHNLDGWLRGCIERNGGGGGTGAKAVDANAAVAIPIHTPGGALRGVVDIAYMGERTITGGELESLARQAEALP